MKKGSSELLTLLKAFVGERLLEKKTLANIKQNLPEVLEMAKIHNVVGIFAFMLNEYYKNNPPTQNEDKELSSLAQKLFLLTIQTTVTKEEMYKKLSANLCKEKIDHIPFKGIVVKETYPVSSLRTYGDVDLIIRPEDREKCHEAMLKMGYNVHTDFEPVYTYYKENELYEIHTSIMSVNITDRADYIAYFSSLWDYAYKESDSVYMLFHEFHFVYLLCHIAKHIYSSGAGVRMYMDLAFYIKRYGSSMDWAKVQKEVEKLELSQFFSHAMACLEKWFDIQIPFKAESIDDEFFKEFTDFTMEAGVFGYEGRSLGQSQVRKAEAKNAGSMRIKALIDTFFPSAKSIQSRYTYLQKRPYLLPIAWVDRFLKNHKLIGNRLKIAKDIVSADREKINESKIFYKKLGL